MPLGILALQGDVSEHEKAFLDIGVQTKRVKRPADLEGISGIVLPGGESTTLSLMMTSSDLFDPLKKALGDGMPAFGTCAGLVLLSSCIEDGRSDQKCFSCLDTEVKRNGYGRQRQSFEITLDGAQLSKELGSKVGRPLPALFIRAPRIISVGKHVEVLATMEGDAVAVRQGKVLATAFHPELTEDRRFHQVFAKMLEDNA